MTSRFPHAAIIPMQGIVILLAAIGFSFSAQATTTATAYPTDFYSVDSSDAANIKIYTGRSSWNCPSAGGANRCNSCAALTTPVSSGFTDACNNQQTEGNQTFNVTIKSDKAETFSTSTRVGALMGSTYVALTPTSGTVGVNQEVTVSINWKDICQNFIGSSVSGSDECKGKSFLGTMKVGFDKDGGGTTLTESQQFTISFRYVQGAQTQSFGCSAGVTVADSYEGFCDFVLFPGDEKVFVNPTANTTNTYKVGNNESSNASNGADSSQQYYAALRLYYLEVDPSITTAPSIAPSSANYIDLAFNASTGNISKNKVTGLTNGLAYQFISASVDQGGNVTYFSDPAVMDFTTGSATYWQTQAAVPQKVVGLLDDKKCFIATAAFGADLDSFVQVLRNFRNEYLMTNSMGRKFVRFYYKESPHYANIISENQNLKLLTRLALAPVLVFAQISLWIGLVPALLIFVLAALTYAYVIWMISNRRKILSGGLE